MEVNQVKFGNETIIDLTDATATASDIASGKTAYIATGEKVIGTGGGGSGFELLMPRIYFNLQSGTASGGAYSVTQFRFPIEKLKEIKIDSFTGNENQYDYIDQLRINFLKANQSQITNGYVDIDRTGSSTTIDETTINRYKNSYSAVYVELYCKAVRQGNFQALNQYYLTNFKLTYS